jgi:hypothetical protein
MKVKRFNEADAAKRKRGSSIRHASFKAAASIVCKRAAAQPTE